MAERYNFKYLPLVGKLPGKSMVEQTETAINELASVVYDNVGYVGNLAEEVQTANTNASNALDKATEALETSSRVYIKQIAAVDVNDYYDSELYYIDNDGSTNIPVRDSGFLEVKTNDDKTACEQVFIADSTGTPYYRHGRITEQTLGEKTTYVVTWSSWYRVATTKYVQGELTNYLPLSGGKMTGKLQSDGGAVPIELLITGTDYKNIQTFSIDGNHRIGVIRMGKDSSNNCKVIIGASNTSDDAPSGIIITRGPSGNSVITGITPPAGDNSTKIATTEFVNAKAGNYLPLSGGTISGTITTTANPGLKVRNNDSYLVLCGASSYEHGAHILLNGEDRPYNEGSFGIVANDGSGGYKILTGKPDGTLTWNYQPLLPVGVVQAFAGSPIPTGWLLCDGSAVSRTDYAALYAVIGTTYGTGDGSTTFNLPNLVDKFVEGSAAAGTVKSAGLPNITGSMFSFVTGGANENQGALYQTTEPPVTTTGNSSGSAYTWRRINLDASRSNSVYGNSNTVQPPALTMRYIIKY